jgi:hypothetical protein
MREKSVSYTPQFERGCCIIDATAEKEQGCTSGARRCARGDGNAGRFTVVASCTFVPPLVTMQVSVLNCAISWAPLSGTLSVSNVDVEQIPLTIAAFVPELEAHPAHERIPGRRSTQDQSRQWDLAVLGTLLSQQRRELRFANALLLEFVQVRPFALASASQFRRGPPPALSSSMWTMDYNEGKSFGVATGSLRTPEQTEIRRF